MTLMSVSASRRCVAKLCRRVCSVAGLPIPAMFLAEVKARLSCRGEIGLSFGLPETASPAAAPRASRRARAPAARRQHDLAVFLPLPSSTWISMRSLSMSLILRSHTSEARRPAP